MELPDEDEHQEDDYDQDDGDGDANQDGRVVRVGGDGLGPGGLTELVQRSVGTNLENIILARLGYFGMATVKLFYLWNDKSILSAMTGKIFNLGAARNYLCIC